MGVLDPPVVPSRLNRAGLSSALPAASAALAGVTWTYTDTGSATYTGRVDRCDGSAWVMIVPPSGTYVAGKFRTFVEDVARLSPDTGCHQGYATDGTLHYTFDTALIQRRAAADWSVLTSNASPFTGLTGVTHLGDGCYFNGKLYIATDHYSSVTTSDHETIAVYDATTLALVTSRDVSADIASKAFSSVCVRPEEGANGVIYGTYYGDGSKLGKWDASTLAYLGTFTLQTPLKLLQGISYYNGVFYLASANGFIAAVNPDGSFVGVPVRADKALSNNYSYEGLDCTTGEIRWLEDRGTGDRKVHYFTTPIDTTVTVGANGQITVGSSPGTPLSAGLVLPGYGPVSGVQFGEDRSKAPLLYRSDVNTATLVGILNILQSAGGTGFAFVGQNSNGNPLQSPDASLAPDQLRMGAANSGSRDVNIKRYGAGQIGTDHHFRAAGGLVRMPTLPSGAIAQTFDRLGATLANTVSLPASGQLLVVGIDFGAGEVVNSITFVSGGTAAGTPTNQWFCLVDSSLNVLAKTVDDTTTAWGTGTAKTLALSAPYTITASGLYYLGIVVVASTTPTLCGIADANGTANAIAPAINGTSTTGLTNPASLGATIAALTNTSRKPWAYAA